MSISEMIKKEATNIGDIILFKDGIFWRAYERSAFLFTTHIKPYQLTKSNAHTQVKAHSTAPEYLPLNLNTSCQQGVNKTLVSCCYAQAEKRQRHSKLTKKWNIIKNKIRHK